MRIRNALLPIVAAVTLWACSDPSEGTGIHTSGGKTGQETEYKAPDYADDYSAIASWDYHVQWNLANIHDPSVAYYDGYYYMYGTDA